MVEEVVEEEEGVVAVVVDLARGGRDFEEMNLWIAVVSCVMNSSSSSPSVNQGPPETSIEGESS